MQNRSEDIFQTNEFKESLQLFENQIRNGRAGFLDSVQLTDIAEYYCVNNNIDQAFETLEYALKLYPKASDPLLYMAHMQIAYREDHLKALMYLEDVQDKTDPEYICTRLEVYLYQDLRCEADAFITQQYQYVSQDEERDDWIMHIVHVFYDYDMIDHALKYFSDYQGRKNKEYWHTLALLKQKRSDYTGAKRIIDKLLDTEPYNTSLWADLAALYQEIGLIEKALDCYHNILTINPRCTETMADMALTYFYKLNDFGQALKYFKCLNHLIPAAGINYIAISLLALGEINEGYELIRKHDISLTLPDEDLHLIYMNGMKDGLSHMEKFTNIFNIQDINDLLTLGNEYLDKKEIKQALCCFGRYLIFSENVQEDFREIAIRFFLHNFHEQAYKLLETYILWCDSMDLRAYTYWESCQALLNPSSDINLSNNNS